MHTLYSLRRRHEKRELPPRHEAELDLALHTYMRRGKQCGLGQQDVDLERGIIAIARSKHGEFRRFQINSAAHATSLTLRRLGDGLG